MRVAPASTNATASSQVFTPPAALIPTLPREAEAITRTASTVAPPAGWNPVEVLAKSAPAAINAFTAVTIASSLTTAVSRMNFSTTGDGTASLIATISCSNLLASPSFTTAISKTTSTSEAPDCTARRASAAFTNAGVLPCGNPATVATRIPASWAFAVRLTMLLGTQIVPTPSSIAESINAASSELVTSGPRRV